MIKRIITYCLFLIATTAIVAELAVQVANHDMEICCESDDAEQSEIKVEKSDKVSPLSYTEIAILNSSNANLSFILFDEAIANRPIEGAIQPPDSVALS